MSNELKDAYRRWIMDNYALYLHHPGFGLNKRAARVALRKVKHGVRP